MLGWETLTVGIGVNGVVATNIINGHSQIEVRGRRRVQIAIVTN